MAKTSTTPKTGSGTKQAAEKKPKERTYMGYVAGDIREFRYDCEVTCQVDGHRILEGHRLTRDAPLPADREAFFTLAGVTPKPEAAKPAEE